MKGGVADRVALEVRGEICEIKIECDSKSQYPEVVPATFQVSYK